MFCALIEYLNIWIPIIIMSVKCFICDKTFSKQYNLNRHRQQVHGLDREEKRLKKASPLSYYDKTVWNYKCLESNCNTSYQKNESLIEHLQQVHGVLFDKQEEIVFTDKNGKLSHTSM